MCAGDGSASTPAGGGRRLGPELRVSRRGFLLGIGAAGGAAALGGIGYAVDQWVGGSPPPWPAGTVAAFRSRPDLRPPVVTVTVPADSTAPGSIFLAPSAGAGQFGPLIVDDRGEPIWFHPISGPWPAGTPGLGKPVATNFRAGVYRGRPVLTWWEGMIVLPGYGQGRYVVLDDRYRQVMTFGAGNGKHGDLHELVLTPEGTALLTWYEVVPADLSAVGGPRRGVLLDSGFQELDPATGEVAFEWSAHRSISLDESYNPLAGTGTREAPWDFFHINSVDLDHDGNYLISARHTWAVYKIDRRSGAVLWRLNGKQSDFELTSRAHFSWQHDARRQPDGTLSLFDDGIGVFATESRSRGILLELDDATRTARLAEEYVQPGPVLASSQGSVQVQPNGNAFVGWGSEPYLSEFSRDGRLLFSAQLPPGGVSYRAFRFPWNGTPDERPALSAERFGAALRVLASWNGATGVDSWAVLAGTDRAGMRPVARARRQGFETEIATRHLAPGDRAVAVAALDRGGRVLARSETRAI